MKDRINAMALCLVVALLAAGCGGPGTYDNGDDGEWYYPNAAGAAGASATDGASGAAGEAGSVEEQPTPKLSEPPGANGTVTLPPSYEPPAFTGTASDCSGCNCQKCTGCGDCERTCERKRHRCEERHGWTELVNACGG